MTLDTDTITRRITMGDDDRADILTFAARLVPETERRHADLVTAAAAPLLEWAAQATSKDDLRARMRALRKQHYSTGPEFRFDPPIPPSRRWGPVPRKRATHGLWVQVPALTVDEFLAEAGKLYAFIAAGRD